MLRPRQGGERVVVELLTVRIDKPAELNVILGQAHFIKTVPDLYGALAGSSPVGVETEQDVAARSELLRTLGYTA